MPLNEVSITSNNMRRIADCNGIRRNISGDNRTGSNHTIIPDACTGQYNGTMSNKHIITNLNPSDLADTQRYLCAGIMSQYRDACQCHIISNRNQKTVAKVDVRVKQMNIFSNLYAS